MKIFHGTTLKSWTKIIAHGFDASNGRFIMFADRQDEAIRYAKSYSHSDGTDPIILTLDTEGMEIIKTDFNDGKNLYERGKIDGILSDTFSRNGLADYFVIFNISKLNLKIHDLNPQRIK